MDTILVNGQSARVQFGNTALLLVADPGSSVVKVMSDGPPQFEPQMRLEIDHQDLAVRLLNHSDLGLEVDNNGQTNIHQLAVEGAVVLATNSNGGQLGVDSIGPWIASASGKRFRLVVDESGNLQQPLPPV